MYDFGLLLKELRENKGLTQQQLAEKVNRTKTVISKYENNLQQPTIETLVQFSMIFNVSLDYLAGIKTDKAVSLDGLSSEKAEIILLLSNLFRENKISKSSGLSKQQLEIINMIIVEFLKN